MILAWIVQALLAFGAVAALLIGVLGLRGALPRNRWVGVRTEQTLSEESLFYTANRVAAPAALAAAVIYIFGIVGVTIIGGIGGIFAGLFAGLAGFAVMGFGGLQGSRAASIQAALVTNAEPGCCQDEPGLSKLSGTSAAPQQDPGCATVGGCGACALQGTCEPASPRR